jgi:hypothetical protein
MTSAANGSLGFSCERKIIDDLEVPILVNGLDGPVELLAERLGEETLDGHFELLAEDDREAGINVILS